ncbi:MAG: hypothetical protein HOQ45_20195 [Nocardioidaceae bacterium]|nr:hypothetical protein [Nocardioidaceae bacterium]
MTDESPDSRQLLLRTLMAKVADETYPSNTTLDFIEELLTPDEVDAYAQMLIGHIENDQFPSIPMIARVRDLLT